MKRLKTSFYLLPLMLAATTLFVAGCKDDEEGNLEVHFLAEYNGQPLETFVVYPFAGSEQISFTHIGFYSSELGLKDGGTTLNLQEVDLIDLSFDNATDAREGQILSFDGIRAGAYSGISFGIGVPMDLNARTPADFPSSSPLSKTSYYWAPWNSYIFSKTEGRLDSTGVGSLDLGFALHTGSDALYRTLEADVPISISGGKTTRLDIVIDYQDLLDGVVIKQNPQTHNPDDMTVIQRIANNLATAVTLRQ